MTAGSGISYISTRGGDRARGFADVALAGLAADGGLYVPAAFPVLSADDLAAFSTAGYIDVAERVMRPFVGDNIPVAALRGILSRALSVFPQANPAPVVNLGDDGYLLELFHGPTLAFKDVALQFLGQLFTALLEGRAGDRVTIVGATSGDTGSAAIEAFKNSPVADIVILHPQGRVSDVQRRQMTTVTAPNVMNIAVEGTFDDCQNMVKAMFADADFREGINLSAVNSINWGRILAQAVYYVYAACRLYAETGKKVSFTVPTGNFGNIYAGYVAKKMGAPIDRLVIATNGNDILHRFMQTGIMQSAPVVPTSSPSMDIQVASNFERILYDVCGHDGAKVAALIQEFRDTGRFALPAEQRAALQEHMASGRRTDAEVAATIRRIKDNHGITIDPHTAVGIGVAAIYRADDTVMVTLATAHPAKFPAAVSAATGTAPPVPPQIAALMDAPEKYDILPNDLLKVKAAIKNFKSIVPKGSFSHGK